MLGLMLLRILYKWSNQGQQAIDVLSRTLIWYLDCNQFLPYHISFENCNQTPIILSSMLFVRRDPYNTSLHYSIYRNIFLTIFPRGFRIWCIYFRRIFLLLSFLRCIPWTFWNRHTPLQKSQKTLKPLELAHSNFHSAEMTSKNWTKFIISLWVNLPYFLLLLLFFWIKKADQDLSLIPTTRNPSPFSLWYITDLIF